MASEHLYRPTLEERAEPGAVDRRTKDEGTVLELEGVTKRFGDELAVVDMDLDVNRGELLTLLGPSGCGKTTTLRLIAGLERPDTGRISIDGSTVATPEQMTPPERRNVGIVFQDFALFPHMSVEENIGFGLSELAADDREERVNELLTLIDLERYAECRPDELSGGQRQRVALARSLAPEPDVLLLDEPFSNLDVDLRTEMREEVRRILKAAGVTGISVTHDQEEALSISDRVVVMNAGRIEQVGRPSDVFQRPRSRFVAGFLGHASFIPGYVSGDVVQTAVGSIPRDRIHGLAPEYDRMRIDVLVRPDDVAIRSVENEGEGDGKVTYRRYLGPTVLYRVELDDGTVVEASHNHARRVTLDTSVSLELAATHELAWFPTEDHSTSST